MLSGRKFFFCLIGGSAILATMAFLSPGFFQQQKKQAETTPTVQNARWAVRWWEKRHRAKIEELKQKDPNLIMIGNSIVHYWETAGKSVWQKYYLNRNAVNLGFDGDRTEHVLWRLKNGELDNISPKVAILLIGTNNSGKKEASIPENTALGIKEILREIHLRLPKTKILLLGIFPRGRIKDNKIQKLNDKVNEIISGYADNKNVFFLDINERFLNSDSSIIEDLMPDFLHFNEKGYTIWAMSMEPMLDKLLSRSKSSGQ